MEMTPPCGRAPRRDDAGVITRRPAHCSFIRNTIMYHYVADRIQARAVLRMGELSKEFTPAPGQRSDLEPGTGGHPRSRTEAAAEAGLSRHQRVQAVRVASVPAAEFEAAVEREDPATVTALAAMGTKVREVQEKSPGKFDSEKNCGDGVRREMI
jgi:hypothetical protein